MNILRKNSSSLRIAFNYVAEDINSRTVNLDEKHFCIVPDKFTLLLEQKLFSGRGAFDAEVLTFNRLLDKMVITSSYLPRSGAVMLLKKIIRDNSDNLICFKKSALYKGFAEKIYDTISLLVSLRIPPEKLSVSGSLKNKIADIRLLYSCFLSETENKYVDAGGRMEMLLTLVKNKTFSNVHFYFAGFDKFTKQEAEIVDILSKSAKSSVIYEVSQPQEQFGDIEFYCAADTGDQLKAAARRIRYNVKNGMKYSDMCIISPDVRFEQTKRILSEFDIPFYVDKKLKLGEQPLSKFISLLDRLSFSRYKRQDVIYFSKNYYLGTEKKSADRFENYCNKYCINYLGFFEEFTYGSDEERSVPEKVRKKIADAVTFYESNKKKINTAGEFAAFIKLLLIHFTAEEKTAKLSDISGNDLSQTTKKIEQTAGLLNEIFFEHTVKPDELFELFFEGLDAQTISQLPSFSDVVAIGGAKSFKGREYSQIFAVDFCEGEIPPSISDHAIINDGDIDFLSQCGLIIEPKVSNLNKQETDDVLFALSGIEKLFLAYSVSGEKRPSELCAHLSEFAKSVRTTLASDEQNYLYSSAAAQSEKNEGRYFEKIGFQCSSQSNALEFFVLSRAARLAGGNGMPFENALNEILKDNDAEKYFKNEEYKPVILKNTPDFFFRDNTTTISKIEEYFRCPYSNFLSNGLKLTEREDGKLSALDIGNFLHGAIEEFVRENDFSDIAKAMHSIVGKLLESNAKYILDSNKAVIERISQEAVKIAHIVAGQIMLGSFKSLGQEMHFGDDENDNLKTIKFNSYGREISLRGIIDRVDIYKNYARIIDYKTGKSYGAKYSFSDLYFGRKIQLNVYQKIMENNGYLPAGAFYFPFSVSWDDDSFTHRLSGVYNGEPELIIAMDGGLKIPSYKSNIIDCKRNASKTSDDGGCDIGCDSFCKSKYMLSAAHLKALSDYSIEVLSNAVDEIMSGFICRAPIENVCSYCKFKTVCKFEESEIRIRKQEDVDSGFIFDSVSGAAWK